ncbi:MAG: glutamate--cysteine ligase [Parvularculaceae bacterium]
MSMAKDGAGDATPIESVAQLAAYLAAGSKPVEDWRIGTEHEKFIYCRKTLAPVGYEGDNGVRAVLERLSERTGWALVMEEDRPIGLRGEGASVSLEPGGQVELSGAPLKSVHQTCSEVHRHLAAVKAVAEPMDIAFLGMGFAPFWTREEMPRMPKARYGVMRDYMPKVGSLGLDMMHRTCTVQVNLDYSSEADMAMKFRVGLALQPIATALFANSSLVEGRPTGWASWRANIWTDTDPDRTGLLDFVFDEGFGFERYVDYMLDVPMYFVRRGADYIDVAGRSFRDFLRGELPELPGERPTMDDWEDHLSTAFPEVRLKRFLEMRGADSGAWSRICALPAFWVGLLYDADALAAAWDVAKGWSAESRTAARLDAARLGLKATIDGRSVRDVALELLEISRAGLARRAMPGSQDADETSFLEPLRLIAESGVTMGEYAAHRFVIGLEGDRRALLEEYSF